MPLLPSPGSTPPANPPSSCCLQSAGEVLLPAPAVLPLPGRPRLLLLLLLLGLVNMPLDPSPSPSPPLPSLPYCGCRTDDEEAAEAGEVLSADPRVADDEEDGEGVEAGAGGEKEGWEAVRYLGAMAAAASISDSTLWAIRGWQGTGIAYTVGRGVMQVPHEPPLHVSRHLK